MRRHSISITHALDGITHALKTQPNFLIHLSISAAILIVGLGVGLVTWEWVVLVITITFGLVIELINTAVENTVDLITKDIHPLAKIAKDCASGAMLVYAIGSSLVGIIIFLPKLWLYF